MENFAGNCYEVRGQDGRDKFIISTRCLILYESLLDIHLQRLGQPQVGPEERDRGGGGCCPLQGGHDREGWRRGYQVYDGWDIPS